MASLAFQPWHPGLDRLAEYAGLSFLIVAAFAVFGLYPLVGTGPAQEFGHPHRQQFRLRNSGFHPHTRRRRRRYLITRLAFTWVMTFVFVLVSRALVRNGCARFSWWGVPTIIFGSGASARSTLRFLRRNATVGLKVVAVFDDARLNWPELETHKIQHGSIQDGLDFAAITGIDHAIIALPATGSNTLQEILRYETHGFKHLLVLPDLSNVSSCG